MSEAYSVGERVRFKLDYALAVGDAAGTVRLAWPDGSVHVDWDSGSESYVEAATALRMIERMPS